MGGVGGLLGKATDFVGLTDYEGQKKEQNAAVSATERAADQSYQLSKENIAFQREQYADWKAVYGDLQDNLGDYYNNLSSSKYATQAIQANQQEFAKTSKQLDTSLAQRGLSSSGAQAASMTAMSQQLAQANATARYSAEDTVKQQQLGFLGVGLGQGSAMLGNIGNAYSSGASTSVQAGSAIGQVNSTYANSLQKSNAAMTSSVFDTAGSVLGGVQKAGGLSAFASSFSDIRFKNNITYTKTINNINFYTWDWNELAIKLGYNNSIPSGVIAQELRLTHPDCVIVNTDGYYMVDYGKLYSILGVNDG